MKTKLIAGIIVVLIAIQFVPTEKNLSNDNTYALETKYEVPADVKVLLENACNDCHTNKSTYPWYSSVQPVGFWLDHHVNEGKQHLNFATFTKLPIAVQNHKLEEVVEQVESEEMPMPSYTYFGLHSNAKLTDADRAKIITWAKSQMAMLKSTYPADSLKMKPRKRG